MWSWLGAGAVGGARTGSALRRGLSALQEQGATVVGQDCPPMSRVQLNQSGSPTTGASSGLQMRETGQPGSRTTHFYDARPIRPFLGQGTAGMELGVMKRILLLKDKMPIKP